MRRQTILVCLASPFLGLAAFSGTASTGCSSTSGSSSGGFSSSSSGGTSSSSSSSSGPSSGSSASSSGGSTSSSGGDSSGSTSGSGTSSGVYDASTTPPENDAGIPLCGSTPCDLTTNTCCVSEVLTGMCIPHGQMCPANNAAFSCLAKTDCTTAGEVCCGAANSNMMVAQTQCQMLGSNGLCGITTPTAGYAQICEKTSECGGGLKCIAQTCAIGSAAPPAHLSMCGLQSSPPFNCTAN